MRRIKKKSFQIAKIGEKRSVDDNGVNGRGKRARKVRSQIRRSHLITNSTKQADSAVIKHSNDTNDDPVLVLDTELSHNAAIWFKFRTFTF
jgi:hypothetical protein